MVRPIFNRALLLFLFCTIGLSPNAQTEEFDLLKAQLARANTPDERWKALEKISNHCEQYSDATLLIYAKQLKQFADSTQDVRQLYTAYQKMAEGFFLNAIYDKALHYDTLTIAKAYSEGNEAHIFRALRERAAHSRVTEGYDKMIANHNKALEYAKSINNEVYQAEANLVFGMSLAQEQKFRKSVKYLRNANSYYSNSTNRKDMNNARSTLALAYLELGKLDSCQFLLGQLVNEITTYGTNWLLELNTYPVLVKSYYLNGNYSKGLEAANKAQTTFKQTNIMRGYYLTNLDKASLYISLGKYAEAKKNLDEATEYFKQDKYPIGNILIDVVHADYYSHLGKNELAVTQFNKAKKDLPKAEFPDVEEEYLRTLYEHYYRIGEYRNGDSTLLRYASHVLKHKEPEAVAFKLKQFKDKNPNANAELIKVLDMIYLPNGQEQLKKLLKNKTLAEIIPMQDYLGVNPYSMATAEHDSLSNVQFNKYLAELEVKHHTQIQRDSLAIQQIELMNKEQSIQRRNKWISISIVVVAFLSFIAFLIFRSRKKALVANEQIALLHDEVYHNVRNQITYVKRATDETENTQRVDLSTLKTRLTSIEKLQELIYKQKQTGSIPMKEYFSEMCEEIVKIYSPDKPVEIRVHTKEILPKETATLLGRMINEFSTNSLKHAFSATPNPLIEIQLGEIENNNVELYFKDNGSGMNQEITDSFGKKFVKSTVKTTLSGKMDTYSDHGTHYRITYPKNYNEPK